jgi:hypothetical protein
VIFALLALGAMAAFALAQHLKGRPLVLDKVVFRPAAFTPNGDCRRDRGRVRFRLTRPDVADIEVVDLDERRVKLISARRRIPSYEFVVVRWNGRNDAGRVMPTGPYKLRVTLHEQDRSLVPPGRFRLHDAPRRPRGRCAPATEEEGG